MTTSIHRAEAAVDIPTTIAAALNVGIHEEAHAAACVLSGGEFLGLTALSASCEQPGEGARRLISLAGPLVNLIIGAALYLWLRRRGATAGTPWYFLWLFMLLNFLCGTGYLLFSGVIGVGDMAVVVDGWSPGWLWRGLLILVGAAVYLVTIMLSLQLFGRRVGGTSDEQIGRSWAAAAAAAVALVVYGVWLGRGI